MFNSKNNKSEMQQAVTNGTGATLLAAGTTLTGDLKSSGDLRIDGTVIGNVYSAAKIIIGTSGLVEGDLVCNQADITGKITGNIRAKELLQLRGDSLVKGNVYTGKLQVEPTATFNGQCHMGTFTEEVTNYDQQKATV